MSCGARKFRRTTRRPGVVDVLGAGDGRDVGLAILKLQPPAPRLLEQFDQALVRRARCHGPAIALDQLQGSAGSGEPDGRAKSDRGCAADVLSIPSASHNLGTDRSIPISRVPAVTFPASERIGSRSGGPASPSVHTWG